MDARTMMTTMTYSNSSGRPMGGHIKNINHVLLRSQVAATARTTATVVRTTYCTHFLEGREDSLSSQHPQNSPERTILHQQ